MLVTARTQSRYRSVVSPARWDRGRERPVVTGISGRYHDLAVDVNVAPATHNRARHQSRRAQGAPTTSTDHVHGESTSTVNGPVVPFRFSVVVAEPLVSNSLARMSGSSGLEAVP